MMRWAGLVLSLAAATLSGSDGFIAPAGRSVWGNGARSKLVGWRAVFPPPFTGHAKLSCSLSAGESGAGGDSVIISPVGDVFELERRVRGLEEELATARRELQEAVESGGAQGATTTGPPARSASEEARLRSQSPNPADPVNTLYNIQDLIRVVDALTADEGCPWTKTQGALDIVMHAQGELREIKEELRSVRPERHGLVSELGDLLFNTILLVKVCERDEIGGVTLAGCAAFAAAKVQRRAPFVFVEGGSQTSKLSADQASNLWKAVKEQEKAGLVPVCPDGWTYDEDKEACVLIMPSSEMRQQQQEQQEQDKLPSEGLVVEVVEGDSARGRSRRRRPEMSMLEMAQKSLKESEKHKGDLVGRFRNRSKSRSGDAKPKKKEESDEKLRKRELAGRFLAAMLDKFGMSKGSTNR